MTGGTGHDLFSLLKLDFKDENDIDFAVLENKKLENVYAFILEWQNFCYCAV
jgi:hypothetical protein